MGEEKQTYEVPGKIVFDNEDDYLDWQSGEAIYRSGLRDSESGVLYRQPDFIADSENCKIRLNGTPFPIRTVH